MTKRVVLVLAMLTILGSVSLWGQNEPRVINGRADTVQSLLEAADLPLLPQRIIGREFCVTLPERSQVVCGTISGLEVGARNVYGWITLGVESMGSHEGELLRLTWYSSRTSTGWQAWCRAEGQKVSNYVSSHSWDRYGEPPQVISTRAVGLELLDER